MLARFVIGSDSQWMDVVRKCWHLASVDKSITIFKDKETGNSHNMNGKTWPKCQKGTRKEYQRWHWGWAGGELVKTKEDDLKFQFKSVYILNLSIWGGGHLYKMAWVSMSHHIHIQLTNDTSSEITRQIEQDSNFILRKLEPDRLASLSASPSIYYAYMLLSCNNIHNNKQ